MHFSQNSLKAGGLPFRRVPGFTLLSPLWQSLLQHPMSAQLLQLAQGERDAAPRAAGQSQSHSPAWHKESPSFEDCSVDSKAEALLSGRYLSPSWWIHLPGGVEDLKLAQSILQLYGAGCMCQSGPRIGGGHKSGAVPGSRHSRLSAAPGQSWQSWCGVNPVAHNPLGGRVTGVGG